jgi:hypothetical protein
MSTPARVLRAFLLTQLRGARSSWPVTVEGLPPGGDTRIAIQDGVASQGRRSSRGERDPHYGVSIAIRSRDYPTGFAKGLEVEALLDRVGVDPAYSVGGDPGFGQVEVAVDGTTYLLKSVTVTVPTVKIYEEETNRRQVFAINARVRFAPAQGDLVWGTADVTWGDANQRWGG